MTEYRVIVQRPDEDEASEELFEKIIETRMHISGKATVCVFEGDQAARISAAMRARARGSMIVFGD